MENDHSMPRYERHTYSDMSEASDYRATIQDERYKNMDVMGRLQAGLAAKFRNNPLTAETLAQWQEINGALENLLTYVEQCNG